MACLAAPLGCAAIAVALIIVACVLEVGGPCWTWQHDAPKLDASIALASSSSYPDPKFAEQLERQLREKGERAVCRSYRSLKNRIQEREEKLPFLEYPSTVERELRDFKKQLATLEKLLREKGIVC